MRNSKKKWAPILCAAVVIALLAAYFGVILYALLEESVGQTVVILLMSVYALVILAAIGGILTALGQRLREIDRGEEEEARKY